MAKMAKSFTLTPGRVWIVIVASFAAYGFCGPGLRNQIHGIPFDWKYALGASISSLALGICIATCLVAGTIVCIEVRAHNAERGPAIRALVVSSVAGTVLPTLLLIFSCLFRGDATGLIFSESLLTAT